ncbi:MAG: T9SS type A sorting domain-containing protein [Paludibacter sp.]|nr:T9SS type A sorting domain-containing protein [Paludibacter sp.]
MKKLITVVLCTLFVLSSTNAKVLYVSPSGNDGNAGDSWANAVKDPQVAMDKALKGDEIWLKGGEYTLTSHFAPGATSGGEAGVWMAEGVSIYGSFAGTETKKEDRERIKPDTEPWAFKNQTVILGGLKKDGTTPLRLFDRAVKTDIFTTSAVIDGLTFRDYDANKSRLIYLKECHVVSNCAFINCADNNSVLYFEDGGKVENSLFDGCKNGLYMRSVGGAAKDEVRETMHAINCTFKNATSSLPFSIYNTGDPADATPTIIVKGCSFLSNDIALPDPYDPTKYFSAGVQVNHGQKKREAVVTECLFENNIYRGNGAASVMINGGGIVNIYNNIIRNNRIEKASEVTGQSAIFVVFTKPEQGNIFNNLIVNNSSNSGLLYLVEPLFFNNTVANNTGNMYAPNAPIIFNNIFSDNRAYNEGTTQYEDAPVMLTEGTFALYLNNANSKEVTLPPSEDISDNVLFTNAGFVAPTNFVGAGDITAIKNADFSLSATSVAKGIGTVSLLGEGGLAYPQTWFDAYFTKDLAGNPRLTGTTINAGAYEEKVSSVRTAKADDFCYVYSEGRQLKVVSNEDAIVDVYDMRGVLQIQSKINLGLNTLNVKHAGLYIVKVSSKSGEYNTFKINI